MAAALPTKMPAGSSAARRKPSRASSSASTANDRCTASSEENSTASQNSPGAARSSTPRSGSRAKANSTSTRTANGAIWFVATRDRASIRRSLPATRAASRHTGGLLSDPDPPAGQRHDPAGEALRPLGLVRGEQDGRTVGRGLPHEPVEQVAPVGVEPGVGLVEQPEFG